VAQPANDLSLLQKTNLKQPYPKTAKTQITTSNNNFQPVLIFSKAFSFMMFVAVALFIRKTQTAKSKTRITTSGYR
jgi:hypothetical protein